MGPVCLFLELVLPVLFVTVSVHFRVAGEKDGGRKRPRSTGRDLRSECERLALGMLL